MYCTCPFPFQILKCTIRAINDIHAVHAIRHLDVLDILPTYLRHSTSILDIFGRQITPQLLPGKKIKQSDGVQHVED